MDICNRTNRPLKIPLPGGKLLRLGPGKLGQIMPKAAEHPPLKKLIEEGQVEIVGLGKSQGMGPSKINPSANRSQGHSAGGGMRQSGDR